MAQEEGAGADDHDQHQDQPEEHGPWNMERPSVHITAVSQGHASQPSPPCGCQDGNPGPVATRGSPLPPSLPHLAPGSKPTWGA